MAPQVDNLVVFLPPAKMDMERRLQDGEVSQGVSLLDLASAEHES